MTRRRSRSANSGRETHKGRNEARAELITWFLLVMVFGLIQIMQEGGVPFPNWFLPLGGAIVLLGSGIFQYTRRWRVSPVTWLGGATLFVLAVFNLYISPERSFLGICLLIFAVVILLGIVTGET